MWLQIFFNDKYFLIYGNASCDSQNSHFVTSRSRHNMGLWMVIRIRSASYAPCRACGKFDRTKWRSSKHGRDDTMLSSAYSVHWSAREVNRSGANMQVVSCHCYLVFHLLLSTHLLYPWTCSGGCLLSSESLTSTFIVMASWASRAKKVWKLCINTSHIF